MKTVSGQWVAASPVPGTVLLNVGDLLENISAGKFPATPHRVLVPSSEEKRWQTRQSIAFFVQPDSDIECQPVTGPQPSYPPTRVEEYIRKRVGETLRK